MLTLNQLFNHLLQLDVDAFDRRNKSSANSGNSGLDLNLKGTNHLSKIFFSSLKSFNKKERSSIVNEKNVEHEQTQEIASFLLKPSS